MQTTNATYNSIIAGKYRVEYKIDIAGTTYTQDKIVNSLPVITCGLFEDFSIGNAVAAELDFWVVPQGVIPPMASITVYFRVTNGLQTSDWYQKGQFYIDTRQENHEGLLHIVAYDSMLKTEYVFMESGSWVSTTTKAVVEMIASDIGVSVETNTLTTLNDGKIVPIVPVIGADGTTARRMLCAIAAMYGGNFIIDEIGKLKLIQLVAPATTIDIGVLTESLDLSPAFDAIDRVIVRSDYNNDVGFRSPDVSQATWDAMTGRILEAQCPWTSQQIADDLLDIVENFVYQPFEAGGANINPACQLGDGITVNGTTSMIYKEVIVLDPRCAANISAPYDEEINHEYPYRSPAQRVVDNAVTKEELITAGQTQINGANIVTGTITLGGNGNGRGELHILDSNGVECGSWDNQGIVIFDDSELMGSMLTDNKIRIVRQGDPEDADEAVKLGVLVLPAYPDFRQPYIELYGKAHDGTNYITASARLSSQQLTLTRGTEGMSLFAYPVDMSNVNNPTRASGLTILGKTIQVFGRVVQVGLRLMPSGTFNAGDNIFVGTITNYIPKFEAMGCGYYTSGSYAGMIDTSGNITIRATSYLDLRYGGQLSISWTYMF